jgi:hypothetical protein
LGLGVLGGGFSGALILSSWHDLTAYSDYLTISYNLYVCTHTRAYIYIHTQKFYLQGSHGLALLCGLFTRPKGRVGGSSVHVKSGSSVHVRRLVVCARFCCVILSL